MAKKKRTKAGLVKDKQIKALHAGKRESADGNIYYENRENRSDKNRTKKFKKGGSVKRTKAGITQDKRIKALHAGKRESADGNIYYENRPNRSDKNRKLKFAEGGAITEGKNGYVAFYKGKQMDVYGDTSLEARDKAAKAFKAKKAWDVTVVLAEKDGKQVTHVPDFKKGGSIGKKKKRSKAGLAQDKRIKALHAGKRESADGNIYYENRENRSDKNRKLKI